MDKTETIMYQNLYERFKGFGYCPIGIDGHNHTEIKSMLMVKLIWLPTTFIAKTIKGKGVKKMENKAEWHYKIPTKDEYDNQR
jgi:transketolase